MFIVRLFTIAKKWKRSKFPSTDECVKKMWDCQVLVAQVCNPSYSRRQRSV
jgi:hypothetical protein